MLSGCWRCLSLSTTWLRVTYLTWLAYLTAILYLVVMSARLVDVLACPQYGWSLRMKIHLCGGLYIMISLVWFFLINWHFFLKLMMPCIFIAEINEQKMQMIYTLIYRTLYMYVCCWWQNTNPWSSVWQANALTSEPHILTSYL